MNNSSCKKIPVAQNFILRQHQYGILRFRTHHLKLIPILHSVNRRTLLCFLVHGFWLGKSDCFEWTYIWKPHIYLCTASDTKSKGKRGLKWKTFENSPWLFKNNFTFTQQLSKTLRNFLNSVLVCTKIVRRYGRCNSIYYDETDKHLAVMSGE